MTTTVVTGAASGMGRACVDALRGSPTSSSRSTWSRRRSRARSAWRATSPIPQRSRRSSRCRSSGRSGARTRGRHLADDGRRPPRLRGRPRRHAAAARRLRAARRPGVGGGVLLVVGGVPDRAVRHARARRAVDDPLAPDFLDRATGEIATTAASPTAGQGGVIRAAHVPPSLGSGADGELRRTGAHRHADGPSGARAAADHAGRCSSSTPLGRLGDPAEVAASSGSCCPTRPRSSTASTSSSTVG